MVGEARYAVPDVRGVRARRRMGLGTASALLAGLLVPSAAHAGLLGPSRPSQLVSLIASAACANGGMKLNTQVNSDATTAAFTIPAGMVLVLTDIEWDGFNLSPGATSVAVYLENAGNLGGFVAVGGAPTQNPSGVGGGSFGVSGIVVKPGIDVCVIPQGPGGVAATAHGFLTKDK